MELNKKIDYILYTFYKRDKKYNSIETKEFFDLELSRELLKHISRPQEELLIYFDYTEIFKDNEIDELKYNLLKYMILNHTKGVDILIEKLPTDLRFNILRQINDELGNFKYISNILFAIKEDNEKVYFLNLVIDEMDDMKISNLLGEIYKRKYDNLLLKLFQNKRIIDVAIEYVNAPFFYEMIEELKLPKLFIDKRKEKLQNIINNYLEYSDEDVKEAFAELYFNDKLNNVYLDIKTIRDFANKDMTIMEYLGNLYEILDSLVVFFHNRDKLDETDIEIIKQPININYEVLAKLYSYCEIYFKSLISRDIKKNVYEGITPRIIKSTRGKSVKIFDIENQDVNQKSVPMLVSSIPIYSNNAEEFKELYYTGKNGEVKYKRRSFSLINESKLSNIFYNDVNRIIFGYEDLSNRKLSASTLSDSQTDGNDLRYRKKRRIVENTLLPVQQFIAETIGHTEILLEMDGVKEPIKPSFILITDNNPTQIEIDIAAEFNIPIRYVNKEKYKQVPNINKSLGNYNYYNFTTKKFQKKINKVNNLF